MADFAIERQEAGVGIPEKQILSAMLMEAVLTKRDKEYLRIWHESARNPLRETR